MLQSKLLVPSTTIDTIIDNFKSLHDMACENMLSKLNNLDLTQPQVDLIIKTLQNSDCLSKAHEKDGPFRSDYMRKQYFKQHFTFIEPIGIRLGADDRGIPKYMHYVPIQGSLTAFLVDQTVIEQCINSATSGFNGIYSNFTDGKIFRQNSSDCIRIMLYQDAFEVANPLGSAKSKHKILAVYYSLGNLMAKHRSRVDQMQLAILFKEVYFKEFGQEMVFKKLVDDLKELEDNGIIVN